MCSSCNQETVQNVDRASKYKEENRQILKESIEVAPFTAKIQRSSDPGMDRDRERSRDPVFPVRIPALTSPSPKASHAHPHVIQSEKSNYFTTLSNSVVNEPPRLYPSKEVSSYYEKVSGVVASIGAAVPNQGALSLGNHSSKASLSKPPPLIKHQPEGGEGLAGKITEQLSQQVTLVQQQHQHHVGMDRIDRRSPAISPSTSTSSSSALNHHHHHHHNHHHHLHQQQQQQLRAMPSLHRAPVFHPPTQHALERKEAAEREREREREKERERGGYGGRLSPPTLTPIQPVNLVAASSKASAEQQKPPTLLPELRDVKGHGNAATITSVASVEMMTSSAGGWRAGEMIQERGLYHGEKGLSRSKPQAAMASVIVRPSTSIKYDNSVGANKSGAIIHQDLPQGRFYSSKLQGECLRLGESVREAGAGRVIQPNSNIDDMCVQYKKTYMSGLQGTMGVSAANSVCRTVLSASPAFAIQTKPGTATNQLGNTFSPRGHSALGEPQEGFVIRTTSPGGSLPPPTPPKAGTPQPSPSLTPQPSSASGSGQALSSSFVHLKKHKAALAAAQSRSNASTAPTAITTGNSPLSVDNVDRAPIHSSPPPSSLSQAPSSSADSGSSSSTSGSTTPGKSSPLPNSQPSGSASAGSAQPSNYHKLKKAWLTRHSEEDRITSTTTIPPSAKPEKLTSPTTSKSNPSNTTAMSEMIKPCTVNLSASTSSEMEMSKDIGSKAEKERQLEDKIGAGGGDDRKAVFSSKRGNKRLYESGSESGGDDSDGSESKMEGRAKRQPKPTYKKKQNDMAKRRGDNEKDEDDLKPNGIFRSAREKTKLKLASSSKFCQALARRQINHYFFFFTAIFWINYLSITAVTQSGDSITADEYIHINDWNLFYLIF